MPYKNKEDSIVNKQIYYLEHKEEITRKKKEYYHQNKKRINSRLIKRLQDVKIFSGIKHYWLRRYFKGAGVCFLCWEINPFVLENHHIFKESDFQVTLCANCHGLMDRFKNNMKIWSEEDWVRIMTK